MATVVLDDAPTGGWLERSRGVGVDTGTGCTERRGPDPSRGSRDVLIARAPQSVSSLPPFSANLSLSTHSNIQFLHHAAPIRHLIFDKDMEII
jgi:hypothetical protein